MDRFRTLVNELEQKLGRELSDKEIRWVLWIINQEKGKRMERL
ncbi:hypothetical protein [Lentibacillus songyuanensis]